MNSSKSKMAVLCAFAFVCIVWLANTFGFLVVGPFPEIRFGRPASAAEWGDSFGVSNALFSALTLVFVFYAAIKQRQELAETQIALRDQEKQAKISLFEQTLFRMIENFQHLTMAIDLVPRNFSLQFNDGAASVQQNTAISRGPDALKILLSRLENSLKGLSTTNTDAEKMNIFNTCYEKYYTAEEWELSHYFRAAYNIYRFIDSSHFIDKSTYIRIFRANHSKAELGLLFYNGLSHRGEKFKNLIEKYQILKHVNQSENNGITFLSSCYSYGAYSISTTNT